MEAFSLLKYWRGGGGGGAGGGAADACVNVRPNTGTTTIVTAVAHNNGETDDDDDDDGPFFDLEFAVPDEDEEEAEEGQNRKPIRGSDSDEEEENDDDDDDEEDEECDGVDVEGEREFGFTLSSGSSNDRADPNLSLSPSDDLFFKGKLVPIESSSLVFNPSEPNSKPQFRVSLLKSATKFRVFMLGFKKSRMNGSEKTDSKTEPKTESKTETKAETKAETNGSVACASKQHQNEPQQQKKTEKQEQQRQKQHQSKFLTVKFKVEEVPIMSLFTRDNSSRNSSASNKSQKQQNPDESSSEEKRFTKEVMQKYLKMVKPLYVRVSKRYGEKLRFSGQLSLNSSAAKGSPVPATATQKSNTAKPPADKSQPEAEISEASPSNAKNQKQGNFPAGLRVVCKHLGKSRSASSAVAAVPPGTVQSRRRDDSLLQQQDGIQSAILHCKRSFNASRDSESSLLPRSVSDPTNEKSLDMSRKSSEEGKDGGHQRL